jgi:hypothetical protein
MKLSAYREDSKKQSAGIPIFAGDAVFYMRRWGTPESQQILKDLRKSLFGPLHKDQVGDENKLIAEWLIEYGCVGWDGVLSEDSTEDEEYKWYEFFHNFKSFFGKKQLEKPSVKEVVYSKQAARSVFSNPEYYLSLNTLLLQGAMNFENYLYDDASGDLDAIKKN